MAATMIGIGLALAAQGVPDTAPTGSGTITVAVAQDSGLATPVAQALAEGVGDAKDVSIHQ